MSLEARERTLAEILRFERNLVLRAGAGSGKTETLTTLALHLLLGMTSTRRPVPPERLVALTFTEKAAGEMRARLARGLRDLAALSRGASGEAELGAATFAIQRIVGSARSLDAALPDEGHLMDLERDLDRAHVTTLHSFAAALLRSHALEAGLGSSFAILEEPAARRLARLAAQGAITAGIRGSAALEDLVEATRRIWAVRRPGAAGLGDLLVDTLVALAETGLAPSDLLLRSGYATERADAALESAARRLGVRPADARDGVVLGALDTLVEAHVRAAEAARRKTREAAECFAIAKRWRARTRSTERERLAGAAGELAEVSKALREESWLRSLREQALVLALLPAACSRAAAFVELLADAAARYDAAKRARDALDFGDLLSRTAGLLRARPDLRTAVGRRHDALLVDEAQDTSPVQRDLLRALHEDPDEPGALRAGGLFLVGDRKQSIYGFRGADVGVLEDLGRDVVASGGAELPLRECFRSVPTLVATTNSLAEAALVAEDPGAPEPFEVVFRAELDGLIAVRAESADGSPAAELLYDDDPPSAAALGRRREADAVARRVRQLVDGGRARFGQIALLLPRMTYVGHYTDAFDERGVPFVVEGGRGLLEAEESTDLLALATVLAGEDDRVALASVLRGPFVALSDRTLATLASHHGGLPRFEALAQASSDPEQVVREDERARLATFVSIATKARRDLDRIGLGAALRATIDATGYDAVLAASPDAEGRLANLDLLVEHAGREAAGARAWTSLQRERIAAGESEREAALATDDMDVVHVMTVHQAKGREHDVVVVADCGRAATSSAPALSFDPQLGVAVRVGIPDGGSWTDPHGRRVQARCAAREAAERSRLLYVAATRARERLIFAGASARRTTGTWSAVLESLPETLLPRVPYASIPEPEAALATPADASGALPLGGSPRLSVARPLARELHLSVSALADFAACPRRHRALHRLGLREPGEPTELDERDPVEPGTGEPPDDETGSPDAGLGPLRAHRSMGTVLHSLLEHLELAALARSPSDDASRRAAARTLLADTARSLGLDPDPAHDPVVALAVERALPFVSGAYARTLAEQAAEVAREVPFVLATGADPRVVLRGRIDLIAPAPGGGLAVLDHKSSGSRPPEHYRVQLNTYRLAVAESSSVPLALVRAGLVLHDRPRPAPVWLETEDPALDHISRHIAELGRALAGAEREDRYEGRAPAVCRSLGCGFVSVCHPGARAP